MSKPQKRTALNLANTFLAAIVPLWQTNSANRKIQIKMESLDKPGDATFEHMKGYQNLTLQEAQEFHERSLNQMKSLEDKAKVSVLGVSLAASLVTGLASSFYALGGEGLCSNALKAGIVALSAISVIYLSMAGWLALHVLGEKNIVYQLSVDEMRLADQEKLKRIALYTEKNTLQNIIRNNCVYAAYRSIIYAVISLGITLVLIASSTYCAPCHPSTENSTLTASVGFLASATPGRSEACPCAPLPNGEFSLRNFCSTL
jgi:hypothetical protein